MESTHKRIFTKKNFILFITKLKTRFDINNFKNDNHIPVNSFGQTWCKTSGQACTRFWKKHTNRFYFSIYSFIDHQESRNQVPDTFVLGSNLCRLLERDAKGLRSHGRCPWFKICVSFAEFLNLILAFNISTEWCLNHMIFIEGSQKVFPGGHNAQIFVELFRCSKR